MATEYLLDLRECKAVLRWVGGELRVTANVTCDDRAQVAMVVPTLPITDQFLALIALFNSHRSLGTECSIELDAPSGQSVRSSHVWLSAWDMGTTSAAMRLDCSELFVTTPAPPGKNAGDLEYLVRGLLCHGRITAEFDFGRVLIGGVTQKDDDSLSGGIVVTPHTNASAEDVDSGVHRVLDVLSFAIGRPLRSSVRQRQLGEFVESRIWPHGDVPPPKWAPFHYLDLTQIIGTAARTYTEALRASTGIDTAIRWSLAPTTYESVRFVQLMIALEHMIQTADSRVSLLPKPIFNQLRDRLRQVIDEFKEKDTEKTHSSDFEALSGSIAHLNQRALKKQIRHLLAAYRVPLDGLDEHIDDLVNLRNTLVHRGTEPPETARQVIEHEMVLRDILARMFLAMLDFDGTYQSWVGGPKNVKFACVAERSSPSGSA